MNQKKETISTFSGVVLTLSLVHGLPLRAVILSNAGIFFSVVVVVWGIRGVIFLDKETHGMGSKASYFEWNSGLIPGTLLAYLLIPVLLELTTRTDLFCHEH